MSVYQSTCERIICSPFVSGITAILSAVYFIRYPSLSSAIVTSFIVKGLDVLQKVLRKYDLERFNSFPHTHLAEEEEQPVEEEEEQPVEEQPVEEEEEQPVKEQPVEEQPVEEQPEEKDEANDEREEDEEYIPSHKPTLKRRTYNLRNRMD